MVSAASVPITPDEGPHSAADQVVRLLGIELLAWDGGTAVCAMTVRREHTNALGLTHGGIVFALADQAIARASNRPGEPAVVTASTIQILRASRPGERLVARASEEYRGGRLGSYRAEIRSGDTLIATATAQALRVHPKAG